MSYLRNCWYMAGWSNELPEGRLLSRTFLGERVVLFRDGESKVKAVQDRCPHRFAPLSRGKVVQGALECGYHGLTFDGSGHCIRNPHGPISSNMAVRHYPMIEAYRALWIWMGEPERASPDMLRDLSFLGDSPDSAFSSGHLRGDGNYQLFADNILDLTHADFLHASSLGSGALTRTRAKVTESDDRLTIQWHFKNEMPSAVERGMFSMTDEDRVDVWTDVEWTAPAIMTLDASSGLTGTPRDKAGRLMNVHIMTPETENTTYYFFAMTRNFAVEDAALNARISGALNAVFVNEDKPMIGAQQEAMGDADFWEMNPLLLRIDEGAVRVRRKLARMIEEEQSRGAAT